MSRPNFHIIEDSSDDFDYESFKEDYMNPFMPTKEIKEKYDLSHSRYCRYGKRVYEDTGYKRMAGRNMNYHPDLNIRKESNNYRIDKQINGRKIYLGSYDSIEEARRVRDFCLEHNWSSEAINYVRNGKLS